MACAWRAYKSTDLANSIVDVSSYKGREDLKEQHEGKRSQQNLSLRVLQIAGLPLATFHAEHPLEL